MNNESIDLNVLVNQHHKLLTELLADHEQKSNRPKYNWALTELSELKVRLEATIREAFKIAEELKVKDVETQKLGLRKANA